MLLLWDFLERNSAEQTKSHNYINVTYIKQRNKNTMMYVVNIFILQYFYEITFPK